MRVRRAALATLTLWWVLGPGQTDPASAADPFYAGLMETGISAYARGDYLAAASDLRVASFGLLEEPETLAECLTYLAVAQGEIAAAPDFIHTIDRLLEVERRFQAFSGLSLDAGLRQALEGHLLTWIPFGVLDRSVVFRDLGRRKRQAEILDMPAVERRQELERRLAAEPEYASWRQMLLELDFAEGDFAAALGAADLLLRQAPDSARARCLRGRSGAALGLCEQALRDLEACAAPFDLALLEARLRCHLALQDFAAASEVLAQVSADDRQRPPFRQLAKDVDRGSKAAAKARAAAPEVEAAPPPASPAAEAPAMDPPAGDAEEPPAAAGELPVAVGELPSTESAPVAEPPTVVVPSEPEASAAPPPSDALRTELARLEALAQSASQAELEAALAAARELADAEPQVAEPQRLAAVIAFRLSRWPDVVTYSRRAGGPEAPDRQFYLAVALYEVGDRAAAKEMLEQCLPRLEPTDFVRRYAEKILGR